MNKYIVIYFSPMLETLLELDIIEATDEDDAREKAEEGCHNLQDFFVIPIADKDKLLAQLKDIVNKLEVAL